MTIGWFLAEEGGFGLNVDILETNLINLVIILGVLFYFGSKFLGKTLSTRKAEHRSRDRRGRDSASKTPRRPWRQQQQKLAQAKQDSPEDTRGCRANGCNAG
jgi:F-type H+-transporting ATPase subunit b